MYLKNKFKLIFFSVSLFCLPLFSALAQGLVPCGSGSSTDNACTLCHLIIGINRLVSYGGGLLITVAAVAVFISGVMYIVSSGSEGQVTNAKNFLKSSLTGFALVLGAWFIVNVVMMWILSFNISSINKVNWYTFECSTESSSSSNNSSDNSSENSGDTTSTVTLDCICANLSLALNYNMVGSVTKVNSKDQCWQVCEQRNATYYKLGSESEYTKVQEVSNIN